MHISTNDLHCCKPARLLQQAPSGGRPHRRPPATAPPRIAPPHQQRRTALEDWSRSSHSCSAAFSCGESPGCRERRRARSCRIADSRSSIDIAVAGGVILPSMAGRQQTAPPQQRRSKDATAHPHQSGAHPDPPNPDRAHSLLHHPAKAKVKFPLRNRIFTTRPVCRGLLGGPDTSKGYRVVAGSFGVGHGLNGDACHDTTLRRLTRRPSLPTPDATQRTFVRR
jgi:hypothetical protein